MSKNIKVEVPKALVSEFINDHQEWVKKGTNRREAILTPGAIMKTTNISSPVVYSTSDSFIDDFPKWKNLVVLA